MPLDGTNFVIPENRVAQCLIRARAKILSPANWCQRTGVDGHRQCAFAALSDWRYGNDQIRAKIILDGVAQARGYTGIMHLNDATSHAQVMSAFREAIEIARADG